MLRGSYEGVVEMQNAYKISRRPSALMASGCDSRAKRKPAL